VASLKVSLHVRKQLRRVIGSIFYCHVHAFLFSALLICQILLQGSAADVAMCAMLQISKNKKLKELGWKLLLQVNVFF